MLIKVSSIDLVSSLFFQILFLAILKFFLPAATFIISIIIVKTAEPVNNDRNTIHFWFQIEFVFSMFLIIIQICSIINLIVRKHFAHNNIETNDPIPVEVLFENDNMTCNYFKHKKNENYATYYFRMLDQINISVEIFMFIFQNIIIGLTPAGFDKIFDSGRITAILFIIIYCKRLLELFLIFISNVIVIVYEKITGKKLGLRNFINY